MAPVLVLRRPLLAICLGLLLCNPLIAQEADAVRMVPTEGEGARYWPRWRGPTGQGLAPPGEYPDRWSATENVAWKVKVPGEGNSSPIVWGERVYLTTAHDKGQRRSVLAFEKATGKLLWEAAAPLPPGEKAEPARDKNGWASGTPATDGARVYAYFGRHGVFCVDAAGKQIWHVVFPDLAHYHGMASSPLLLKDKLVILQDHQGKTGSFLLALDPATGKQLWKTPRKEKIGWTTPAVVHVAGGDQIVVSSENRVYAYDAATGAEVWNCGGNTWEAIPTPVVGRNLLFCSSGRAGPTLAIQPTGAKGDITRTGHVVWKSVKGSSFVPSTLLLDDYLYMVNDVLSVVTCYEARTGKIAWQERCGEALKEGFSASPVAANGRVYFTNDQGETFVLKAGPTYELLHVNRFDERTLASPALAEGRWYWRTQQHLYCVGK